MQSLALALVLPSLCLAGAGASLPWEKDYATALAKAKAGQRPMFIMLTATWCGPCKLLEAQTLTNHAVLEGLKEFVWVKAYEDKALDEKFEQTGYPTLVFFNPETDQPIYKTAGYQPAGEFIQQVIKTRQIAGLPMTKEMKEIAAKIFVPDMNMVQTLQTKGDVAGLVKYLAPAQADATRDYNYLVAKLTLPAGVSVQDLLVTAGAHETVPSSGVVLVGIPRDDKDARFTVLAPGCRGIDEPMKFDKDAAVRTREFKVERLTPAESAILSGRVLKPDGQPAAGAIVRILDWALTKTDTNGAFKLEAISPGTFQVRAEYPGGEYEDTIDLAAGQELKKNLKLKPAATVSIRWALQTKEGARELTGAGVRTGEACFSPKHSRFLLERGAEVREGWGSDFMLNGNWKGVSRLLTKEQLAALEGANEKTPIFWLFDAADHPSGLHAETNSFDQIKSVNDGKPYDEKGYFKFLRGDIVRKGQVYTVHCVKKNCYAKLEITDVTVPEKAAGK